MKLTPEWRRAWRWISMHVAAGAVAWGMLDAETQASLLSAIGIPPERVAAIIGALVILGRLVGQRK
jgi:hypothetical protein